MVNTSDEHPVFRTVSRRAVSSSVRWALLALALAVGTWFLWPERADRPVNRASSGTEGPNILLITADTTRADYIGCYGNEDARTSSIDRLASQGVMFRQARTCTSLTTPSHASILTGNYPFVHGVRDNGSERLAAQNTTLAEILKDVGFTTAAEVAAPVLEQKFGLGAAHLLKSVDQHPAYWLE